MKKHPGPLLFMLAALLTAMTATASASPTGVETRPLQYTSGGHVLGFTPKNVVVAAGSHALRIEFVGASGVEPVAAGPTATAGQAVALTRVAYRGLWGGIDLAYDAPAGLLRSTYALAPGADPAQIRLRYNAPVVVEPGGTLRIALAAGAMRESAPIAWQEAEGRRVPVTVAFRRDSEREVGFVLGPYDKSRPLTIDPTLTWSTFLGGSDYDTCSGMALDANGNVYVTGFSNGSWGTPIRAWAGPAGSYDAFAAKVDSSGALQWNTFLGGNSGGDVGYGIAVDASGNAYVAGSSVGTWGTPIRPAAADAEAFVVKLGPDGDLLWNTFLGGGGSDSANAIAVTAGGVVSVAGSSYATWGTPIRSIAGFADIFVARLNTNGALLWNTFLGGSGYDFGQGIAVDAGGNTCVTGKSDATWGAPIRMWTGTAGVADAVVARLNGSGVLQWNTFLGGTGFDEAFGVAFDAAGNAYVTGTSYWQWGAPIRPFAGPHDSFVAKLSAAGFLQWTTFGGEAYESGRGIAVVANGDSYVSGWVAPGFPWAGEYDGFVARLDTNGEALGDTFTQGGGYVAVDTAGTIYVAGTSSASWGAPVRPFAGRTDAFVEKLDNLGVFHVKNDVDGDGRSDIGCYYPPGGNWYGYNSGNAFWQMEYGAAGTIPVTGDFDGDGKGDLGVYDPPTGNWYLYQSGEGYWQTQFGYAGTIPVVGDFDGDGRDDIGCYYAPGGNWYVYRSTEGFWETQFGYAGTIPVVGDYDGDGRDDIGCYYPPGGNWYVYRSRDGFWETQFGYDGTIPVVGDFDGDGRSDIGCYYPPGGNWYVYKSTEGFWSTVFGYVGTEPVVGDFDGDGRSDLGCYYPAGGNWYVFKSTEGFWETQFGYEGTIPLGGTLR